MTYYNILSAGNVRLHLPYIRPELKNWGKGIMMPLVSLLFWKN
jgi:hypothetical protein